MEVARNFFGSQRQSFEASVSTPLAESGESDAGSASAHECGGVFIRAPAITGVGGGVQVLGTLRVGGASSHPAGTVVVAARQGHMMATAFHPELTEDLRWHSAFVRLVREERGEGEGAGGGRSE